MIGRITSLFVANNNPIKHKLNNR